jgi:hypothetical protein
MGTSADYSAPPNWSNIKGNVTRSGGRTVTPAKARELIREHIATNGGSGRMSSGRGQLGNGATARKVAQRLGGFLSSVARDGLDAALRSNGLGDLVGKSVTEIVLGILTLCGGTDGDQDSVDARNALSETMDILCKSASTPEELGAFLEAPVNANALGKLMMIYFGNYLYQQFCRVFFAQLIKKHGDQRATSFLREIKDVITSNLENATVNMNLATIDWFGNEGKGIAKTILQNTLAIFE